MKIDGYVDTPKAVAIKLSNGDEFCVEFHPGDTIYYINDIQIGCTGSSYMIRNISLAQFYEYISNMNGRVKKREFFHSSLLLVRARPCFQDRVFSCSEKWNAGNK